MATKKIYITYDERLTPTQALEYASQASATGMKGVTKWRNGVAVWFKQYRKHPNIEVYIDNAD